MTTGQATTPHLSRSRFMAGCQCLKRLYWQVHARHLAAEPDEATRHVFDMGHLVGATARLAFPGGVPVEEDHPHHERAVRRTRELMDDPAVPAIFEAAFTYQGVRIRVDILERRPRGRWRLIDVEQATGIKEQHLLGVAVQRHVLEGLGLELEAACLMHPDRGYVYDGETLDLDALFHIGDVSEPTAEMAGEVRRQLRVQRSVVRSPLAPSIAAGPHCSEPHVCEFWDQCNQQAPEGHVSELPRMSRKKLEELEARGIELIRQLPDDYPLSELQERVRRAVVAGGPYVNGGLHIVLAQLRGPLCFMDFETIGWPIPRYAGTHPYEHVPFQWSVHVRSRAGARPKHFEFLHDGEGDPREPFVRSLLEVLERHEGPIVVYHVPFEARILREMADVFPAERPRIQAVIDRLWDLLPPIRENIYHPRFGGSFSLKAVLPALVPAMSYDDMAVANGSQAGVAYAALIDGDLSATDRARLRNDLLAYCRQDTLAMVELLAALRQLAGRER